MTGKEALKEWIDHYKIDCHKYCGDSFLEKLKIIEEYLEELEVENVHLKEQLEFSGLLEYETKKELTKYKRVFEILKEVLVIPEDNDIDWYDNDINYYKLRFTNRLIKENEKELLEELMKSEQNQI